MNWLFSPLGIWLLACTTNMIWFFVPWIRQQLSPRARSWVHLTLLALPGCIFFWWMYQGISLFFYGAFFDLFFNQQFTISVFLAAGASRLLSYYQTTGILLRDVLEPLEYYILTAPLLVHAVLMVWATSLLLIEQLMTFFYLQKLKKVPLSNFTILETNQALAFTSGFLRPQIYISRQIWESEWREAIVQHEQKHQQRFDPLRLGLARFFYRLSFFYPFATWLWQQYQVEIESLCDQKAAQLVGVKKYASALLDYAELRQKSISIMPSFSSPTMLEQRLGFLLHKQQYSKIMVIWVIFGVLMCMALMLWGRANSTVLSTTGRGVLPVPASSLMKLGLQLIELDSQRFFVTQIVTDGLADKAGLQVGDEILTMCKQAPKKFFVAGKPWIACNYEIERALPKYRFQVYIDPNR